MIAIILDDSVLHETAKEASLQFGHQGILLESRAGLSQNTSSWRACQPLTE